MRSWRELLIVAVLGVACAKGGEDDTGGDTGGLPLDGTDPCETITWQTYGEGAMRDHCTGCHSSTLEGAEREGAPAGVDLDTLDAVRSLAPRIEARVLDGEPTMPPVGGPGEVERERLRTWLECGMPE